jgi:hypothetical protein
MNIDTGHLVDTKSDVWQAFSKSVRRKYEIVPPGTMAAQAASLLAGRAETHVPEGHPLREALTQSRAERRRVEREVRKQAKRAPQ